jgi:F-type H+-transporting ATPase subunit a
VSTVLAASGFLADEGKGFQGPGPKDFDFPGIFSHNGWFTKPILIAILATIAIGVFYWASARKASMVPSKLQFAGESIYGFVRNDIALDAIGHEGRRFAPYLATLFSFVAINNLTGIVPFLQFPVMSHIAFPLVLAVFSWLIFLGVGIKRAGFAGYFKGVLFPPGVPWPVYILLTPLEFFSTIIVRPVTLMLRLTFNMFAGHLVLLLFILGGEYLLTEYGGFIGIAAGSISILGSIVLTFFEGFVMLIQAYVFTLLTALYIGGALADEH